MQLTLVREATGQMHLEGIGLINRDAGRTGTAPPLPSGLRLVNTRVVWIDRKAGKPPFRIDNVDIVLDREGSRLDLRARLETASGNADLSARLDGFLSTRDWGGDTYLKLDNLDIADLFAHYLPTHYGLHGLQLNLESWGQWHNALPAGAQGSFQIRDLRLRPKTRDAVPLNLRQAGANFSMSRAQNDLRFGLNDLVLVYRDHQWPFGDLAVELKATEIGRHRKSAFLNYIGYGFAWTKQLEGLIAGNPAFLEASQVELEKKTRFPYRGYGFAWTQEMAGQCGGALDLQLCTAEVAKKERYGFPYQGYGFAWARRAWLTIVAR